MVNITVIDGQGGKIGSLIVEKIKKSNIECKIMAIGTNSIATSNMLKAGADNCATGENAIVVGCENADYIVGPIGIISADSLFGEITEKMAVCISRSKAYKILIPFGKCKNIVVGCKEATVSELVCDAVNKISELVK